MLPIKNKMDSKFKEYIKNRDKCKGCPLRGNTVVIMDALYDKGKCDILFVGINPGKDEAKQNAPFVGRSGQILRDAINKAIAKHGDFKVAFTNAILCSTNNEKDIPNINECLNNCKYLLYRIIKYLQPKIVVPVGKSCAEHFGVSGSIHEVSGSIYDEIFYKIGFITIMPIFHPASLLYSPSKTNKLKFYSLIEDIFLTLKKREENESKKD